MPVAPWFLTILQDSHFQGDDINFKKDFQMNDLGKLTKTTPDDRQKGALENMEYLMHRVRSKEKAV
jgi:hypothetical protein